MSKLLNSGVRAVKPKHKPTILAASFLLALCTTSQAFSAQPTITPTSAAEASQASLYDTVTNRAKILAKGDFKALVTHIPEPLAKMDYDQYRSIRFRPD